MSNNDLSQELGETIRKKEFDVDTGTYMEDVHCNDLIGVDKDGNGLVDNVEELIEEADRRARDENNEKERLRREEMDRERQENDEKEADASGSGRDVEIDK